MRLTTTNTSVLRFSLSYFLLMKLRILGTYRNQISTWVETGELQYPLVVMMPMNEIADAHDLIQSGKSIGKVVIVTQ